MADWLKEYLPWVGMVLGPTLVYIGTRGQLRRETRKDDREDLRGIERQLRDRLDARDTRYDAALAEIARLHQALLTAQEEAAEEREKDAEERAGLRRRNAALLRVVGELRQEVAGLRADMVRHGIVCTVHPAVTEAQALAAEEEQDP